MVNADLSEILFSVPITVSQAGQAQGVRLGHRLLAAPKLPGNLCQWHTLKVVQLEDEPLPGRENVQESLRVKRLFVLPGFIRVSGRAKIFLVFINGQHRTATGTTSLSTKNRTNHPVDMPTGPGSSFDSALIVKRPDGLGQSFQSYRDEIIKPCISLCSND